MASKSCRASSIARWDGASLPLPNGRVQRMVSAWRLGFKASKCQSGRSGQGSYAELAAFGEHFQNNAQAMTFVGRMPVPDLVQNLIDDLFTAIESEAEVFVHTFEGPQAAVERLFAAFLGRSAEAHRRNPYRGLLGQRKWWWMRVQRSLPRCSLGRRVARYGHPHFSHLRTSSTRLECQMSRSWTWSPWTAAVGVTVIYKVANGERAPFADDATSRALIAARAGTSSLRPSKEVVSLRCGSWRQPCLQIRTESYGCRGSRGTRACLVCRQRLRMRSIGRDMQPAASLCSSAIRSL